MENIWNKQKLINKQKLFPDLHCRGMYFKQMFIIFSITNIFHSN